MADQNPVDDANDNHSDTHDDVMIPNAPSDSSSDTSSQDVEPTSDETDAEPIKSDSITFNKSLAANHTYLGEDLEELHGCTVLPDREEMIIPILLNEIVLFPYKALPLSFEGDEVAFIENHLKTSNAIVVAAPIKYNSSSHSYTVGFGCTAEIHNKTYDYVQNLRELTVTTLGRQRVRIIRTLAPNAVPISFRLQLGVVHALPDNQLPHIPPSIFNCSEYLIRSAMCASRFVKENSSELSSKDRDEILKPFQGIIPTDFTIGGIVEKIPSSKEVETETPEALDPAGGTDTAEFEVMKTEVGEVSHIICMNQNGHLAGYSECLIEFEFAPDEACVEVKDFAINFTQEGVEQIKCTVCAESTELSILVDRDSLDMRICTVGCFYQDSIVFHNQAIHATNISTDIPSILDNTIRILPINALIQGQDKLTLHLQFTPNIALWNEKYRQFYSPETAQFEVHFNFIAKGLSLPLPFTLKACLTRAELSFDTKQINFGTCHMQESSVTKVHLTNHSLLPQKVGFINVPQAVEIRPSDGFLTLLPKETCAITIVFSPDKIKLYEFTLTCKSLYDKDYLISCTGKGIQSGLKLSHTRVTFRDTVLDNFSFAKIAISNPKISRISSAKVRGVAPVTTNRIFHFEVPNALPIKITPEIGNLAPGEETKITIQFSPVILREDILELARELHEETMSKSNDEESGSRVSVTEKKGSSVGMMSKNSRVSEVVREEVNEDTPTWSEAKHKLTRAFQSKTETVRIPCFVSIATQSPTYLPDETLHLDFVLPSIAPKLFLKNVPNQSIEFGQCLIGMKVIRRVEVENNSDTELTFAVDPLDIHGPFEVLNAPRPIAPGKSFNVVFEFVPNSDEVFHEQCIVRYAGYHRLVFFLNAEGVKTELELVDSEDNPIGEELDVGDVVVNESLEFHLAIKNLSVIACQYYSSLAELDVGLNTNGLSAFDMHLFQGEIAPTSKREMKIMFTPDRPSLLYAEEISIRVNKKEKFFKFKIKGRAHEMNMHVHPDLIFPYDLMSPPPPSRYRDITKAFVYMGGGETVQKHIRISNVKHRTTGFKPNGEFHFELVDAKSPQKAFQIEPMKSTLEAGNTIDVKITFDHKQIEETHPVLVYYKLTLKGDSVKQHSVLLSGRDENRD